MRRSGWVLALVIVWVCSSIAVDAMTFVPMSVDDLTQSSVATVIGTVESVTGTKSADGRIFTLVRVVVDWVVRGNLTAPVITLKEPGGTVGSEQEVLFGAPSFEPGKQVMLFLSVGADGSLHTTQLALGKFDIEVSPAGVPQAVQRFAPGTTVVVPRGTAPLPSSMPLDDLVRGVEGAAPATSAAPAFQTEPLAAGTEEVAEPFKLLGSPPARLFEVDDGQPISYLIDQNGDAALGLAASRQAVDDGFDAWTNVPTAAISLVDGGLTADLSNPCTLGAHKIRFNDPDGTIQDPTNCGGILGVGGYCSTSSQTKVVNGKTFNRILRATLTLANGWGACGAWTQCNVAEVATHELGHSIGLGHSSDSDATMYFQAHFDGRCAAVRTDDANGVTFIYPPPNAHDSVVLPVTPVTVTLASGTLSVTKTVRVSVRNADKEAFGLGHTIQLSATTSDCPGGTIADLPDFDRKTPAAQDSTFINGGRSKTATVPLVISSAAFATFNRKAPARCTITFTASTTDVPGNVDPNPSNDVVTMELNVIDKNDPEMSAVHESVVTSLRPVSLSIADGALSKVTTVRPAVVNADTLPQPEDPGHLITLTASDGTCPPGTVGIVDYDSMSPGSQNAVTVKGGRSASGKLAVTATSAGFTTTNAKSPQRCTAVLTASGPGGDSDATNDSTNVVIDVIDRNDF